MMRVLPTVAHGVLDYAMGILLFVLPRMLGWSAPVTTLMTVMAAATLIYSLLTRYECGAFKVIPMSAHLALDILSGILFLGAAFIMRNEPENVRTILAVIGAFEIGAGVMTRTDPFSSRAGEGQAGGGFHTRQSGF